MEIHKKCIRREKEKVKKKGAKGRDIEGLEEVSKQREQKVKDRNEDTGR